MEIGLSLGSNLGDRLANLSGARDRIVDMNDAVLLAQSPVYETDPVGVPPEFQHLRFLNAVLIVESSLGAMELLRRFAAIEKDMLRVRKQRANTPRPIDIDMVYAGQEVIDRGGIVVPHARWGERAFVVKPLNDVRPGLHIPGSSGTVREILLSLPDSEKLVPFAIEW